VTISKRSTRKVCDLLGQQSFCLKWKKQLGWKEKESDWSSAHDVDQAPSFILFSGLDSSGHGVAPPAPENSAHSTIAPRRKTHARRQVLTTASREKERRKTIPPPC